MKSLLPVAALLLIFTGCASAPKSAPPAQGQAVAKLQEHVPSPVESPTNKEIRCHIQMIDGVEASTSEKLLPGHHRVIVALGTSENEHVGDVSRLPTEVSRPGPGRTTPAIRP